MRYAEYLSFTASSTVIVLLCDSFLRFLSSIKFGGIRTFWTKKNHTRKIEKTHNDFVTISSFHI